MKHALCFIFGIAVGIIAGLVGQFFYRLWAVPVLPMVAEVDNNGYVEEDDYPYEYEGLGLEKITEAIYALDKTHTALTPSNPKSHYVTNSLKMTKTEGVNCIA